MKPGLIIFGFLLPVCFFGQTKDRDSLRFILTHVKDSARIDCLNELSLHFIERSLSDSAIYYAETAHSESKSLGYIHGIATFLSLLLLISIRDCHNAHNSLAEFRPSLLL